MKKLYDIKINRNDGKGFVYIGDCYLNSSDSSSIKSKKIKEIREKFNFENDDRINISNFFNVYR